MCGDSVARMAGGGTVVVVVVVPCWVGGKVVVTVWDGTGWIVG